MCAHSAYSKTDPLEKVAYGRQITVENGLSSNFVYTLLQDSRNFMWIGTVNGLNKYDGHSFRHYFKKPFDSSGLQSNVIKALAEDRHGVIWVGTAGGGLARLDRNTDKFAHYKFNANDSSSIGSDNIEALLIDSKGRLWIGLGNGELDYFDSRTQKFWKYSCVTRLNFGRVNNSVISIAEVGNGKLYIRKVRGTVLFDPSTGGCNPFIVKDSLNTIRQEPVTLAIEPKNSVGILYKDRALYSFQTISSQLNMVDGKKIDSTVPTTWANRIICQNSQLWCFSSLGLQEINLASSTIFNITVRLTTNATIKLRNPRDAVTATDGSVWVATESGVVILEPLRQVVAIYPLPNHYTSRDCSARSLCMDRNGRLWIGTSIGSLYYLDSDTLSLYREKVTRGEGALNRMRADESGMLWIATTLNSLLRVNTNDHTVSQWKKNLSYPLPTNAHSILLDGASVWIGSEELGEFTNEGVLNRITFSPFSFQQYEYLSGDATLTKRRIVTTIVKRDEQTFWIGSIQGLFLFNKQTSAFTQYSHNPRDSNSLSGNDVWAIHKDRIGQVWVGTWGDGLNLFDERNKNFHHYTIENGLPGNTIFAILEDINGDLWISTDNGISHYDQIKKTFTNFGIADGLLDRIYEPNSAAIASDGKLYFGGARGVVSFYPHELSRSINKAPLIVTAFRVSEKLRNAEVGNRGIVRLDHTENDFSFEFAKLDYLDPTQKVYQYKLEGVDHNWINSGKRNIAYYNNIDPGDYVFRFRESGDTTLAYASMIVITPAFWMTRWFRLGVFFATVLLIGYLFRRRISKLKEFQAQLGLATESERIALAGELHDGPLQDLYATRFMIDPFIASGTLTTEATKLDILLKKVRSDLRTMTGELQIPRFELGFAEELRLFCDAFCERHPDIQIELDVTNEVHPLPPKSSQNLFRIFRTAMANVAKHANASKVTVTFVTTENKATLKIADDGIGFEVPKTLVTLTQTKHYGLLLMQNYAASINGKCSLVSAPGSGTTVEVLIPLKPPFWWKKARRASL
jgi:ligand-binding sensor domain-containing protein/signal transduction histidine kinase